MTLGVRLRPALQALAAANGPGGATRKAAGEIVAGLPATPTSHVRIEVLGPLVVQRDEGAVDHPDLRRQRVRELLTFLVVHRRARREEITDELWPELDDRGRNLRVTLNYLQRVLQPDRDATEPPYFLRADGAWLALDGPDRLTVDLWELDALLDQAAAAERDGSPAAALDAYARALRLWRGEPLADVPYADWAERERQRLRSRFTAAAVRAGELSLAAGAPADARAAAEQAINADPSNELAYQLLARTHLADDDPAGARRAVDACTIALADLGVTPSPATVALGGPTADDQPRVTSG